MRLLVDTKILLWASSASDRLDDQTIALLEDRKNVVLFSPVSIWEIAIKASIKRVNFTADPETVLADARHAGFQEICFNSAVATRVAHLPHLHSDPFDRLLIAQAMAEPATFLTTDRLLARYSDLVTVVGRPTV